MFLRVFILVIWFTLATYPGKQWHVSIFYWLMTHPVYLNPSGFSVWVFVLWDSYDGCSTVPCRLSYEQVYVRVKHFWKIDATNLKIVDKMRSIDRSLRWLDLPARQKIGLFLRYLLQIRLHIDYTKWTVSSRPAQKLMYSRGDDLGFRLKFLFVCAVHNRSYNSVISIVMNNLDQSHVAKWMDICVVCLQMWFPGIVMISKLVYKASQEKMLLMFLKVDYDSDWHNFLPICKREAGKLFCEQTHLIV